MIDWNIQSRSHACQACHRPFADKQPYHTLLFDRRHAYAREDVCESCWTARSAAPPANAGAFVSHWQGVFTVPPPPPPDPIRKDTAESLLRKLVARQDPQYIAACFILAVMLERKRLLKVKATDQQEGRRLLVYEDPRTGDCLMVPDPGLRLDELEEVQRDVMTLLEHGLPEPPAAEAPPPAASPGDPPSSPATEAAPDNPPTPPPTDPEPPAPVTVAESEPPAPPPLP